VAGRHVTFAAPSFLSFDGALQSSNRLTELVTATQSTLWTQDFSLVSSVASSPRIFKCVTTRWERSLRLEGIRKHEAPESCC